MKLFNPYKFMEAPLLNRVVMSPMTRARNTDGVPNATNSLYYSQRSGSSGAGLIVTEGLIISPTASGVLFVPGIYTDEQVAGWKSVVDQVHQAGSKIYAQLWHVGRVSHYSTQPNGNAPLSSSAIRAANTNAYGYTKDGIPGFVEASRPVSMDRQQLLSTIADYVHAAKNAIIAGFDGIEIHAANGYLMEQFLNPHVNMRQDEYGGNIENRSRFLLEVVEAISEAIGASRVGVRLSPFSTLNDMKHYDEIEATYYNITEKLNNLTINYIHLMNMRNLDFSDAWPNGFLAQLRSRFKGTLILAGGMTATIANELLDNNLIDLAAFGRPFISNPDLTDRMYHNWPLAEGDRTSFYGGNHQGYTDYPTYHMETKEDANSGKI
ncbi:alkene reductase [Sphingobacterium sp. SYP-B4668]|uniref:alkene reductase n=1 Tax=Sphingobacterium sp. SYP-B4668 TaxID=2996035 RepID=UPI0022DD474F|nr:alkene reductase [Sphingobacterium sp. SYP-B4668]